MMYGIAPGPTIWQREIEKILQGIPGVAIFFDDIVVTGSTDEEHLTRLEEVLSKLHKFNVRINLEKSKFFLDKVDYCGRRRREEDEEAALAAGPIPWRTCERERRRKRERETRIFN